MAAQALQAQAPIQGTQPAQGQQPVSGSAPQPTQTPATSAQTPNLETPVAPIMAAQALQAQAPIQGTQPAQGQQPVSGSEPQHVNISDDLKSTIKDAMSGIQGINISANTGIQKGNEESLGDLRRSQIDYVEKQQSDYRSRAEYQDGARYTGTYQNITEAAKSNPIHPAMSLNGEQKELQHEFAKMSSQYNGPQMTALDINQTHQTRHLAQQQADYIKEVSRGMNEMVESLSDMNERFEEEKESKSGKIAENG
jgi:predicted transglutaminase-like cysteine proteinase